MYDLPTSIAIDGVLWKIRNNADYRTIIDIIALTQDPELNDSEIMACVIIAFFDDINTINDIYYNFRDIDETYKAIMRFISLNDDEVGHTSKHKLIDWIQDEKLIVAEINKVANTEIRVLPYLHWWTFIGYYTVIGEGPLSQVVGIRAKIAEGRKLDKSEQKFRRDNPQYFVWKNELEKERKDVQQFLDNGWN